MTFIELQQALTEKGIQPKIEAGRLKLDAPKGALTLELKAALQKHKAAIIASLNNQQNDKVDIREEFFSEGGIQNKNPTPNQSMALMGSSPKPLFVVSHLRVMEIIFEEVKKEWGNANLANKLNTQLVEWKFNVCIHHEREEDSWGFYKLPLSELTLCGNSCIDELLPTLEKQVLCEFGSLLEYKNPYWDWNLQLTLPSNQPNGGTDS
ncbi:MAG: hypothetical protein HOP19_19485 [Acidobacteria bacterium]|nr:hypothetical protein [Acidobacteriota bacterium]